MDPALATMLSGAAATGGNIISSILTNNTNRRLVNQSNDLQRELAAQANQWSIEQWNRENAYNLPTAQMQRLRDAGLNPALIYGQGGIMNEAAASPSVQMASQLQAAHMNPIVTDPLTAAQIAKLNAETDLVDAQTDEISTLLPYQRDAIKAATANTESMTQLNQEKIKEVTSLIAVNEEQANNLNWQTQRVMAELKEYCEGSDARLRVLFNQADISDRDLQYYDERAREELKNLRAYTQQMLAAAQESKSKKKLNDAQAAQIQQEIDNFQHTLDHIDAETASLKTQKQIYEEELRIKKKYGEKEAKQRIHKMRQETISGYMNSVGALSRDFSFAYAAVTTRGVSTMFDATKNATARKASAKKGGNGYF